MNPEFVAARSSRVIVISVVAAAVAITACALVAIAVMLGWISPKAGLTPLSSGAPGLQMAGTAAEAGLAPGETLVAPAETPRAGPAPLMPSYSSPAVPRPAPTQGPIAGSAPLPLPGASAPLPSSPAAAQPWSSPTARGPSAKTPVTPTYGQAPAARTYAQATRREGACANCGTISGITTYADSWDVHVQFEDGTARNFRYLAPPPFRLGNRVRLDNGRLNRD